MMSKVMMEIVSLAVLLVKLPLKAMHLHLAFPTNTLGLLPERWEKQAKYCP